MNTSFLFRFGIVAVCLGLVVWLCCTHGIAATPSVKIGDTEVFVVQDSAGEFPNRIFSGGDQTAVSRAAPTGTSPNGCNVFVVKTPDKVVLVDTGMKRKLLENLAVADIKPADISVVLLTHTHGDHTGGLLSGDAATFPNATLYLTQKELDFWRKSNAAMVEKCEKVYGPFGLVVPDGKTPVAAMKEITALDAAGHTPGHVVYLVYSLKQNETASSQNSADSDRFSRLLIAGDLLHSQAIQFPNPDICATYDADVPTAVAIRKSLLTRAAQEGWLFTAVHLPLPAVGRVQQLNSGGFQFDTVLHR